MLFEKGVGWFGTHLGWWLPGRYDWPNRFTIALSNILPAHHGVSPVSGRSAHLLVQLVEEGVDAFLVDAVNNKGEGKGEGEGVTHSLPS
jgi:hypothetical protein